MPLVRALRGCAAALACVLYAAPASAEDAPEATLGATTLQAETFVLGNGLTVLLAPDPSSRFVSVRTTYHAGVRDDPPGLRGLAHLTEHMVGARTKHAHAVLHFLASIGATGVNATTTFDRTDYFETVTPERLETALWLEADRMAFASPSVTDDRVSGERAVLDNEERMRRRDTSIVVAASLEIHELFPPDHRYAPSADHTTFEGRFSARDVRAFLATWYWPSNATLAIAGNFDSAKVHELALRYFGRLPSLPVAVRPPLSNAHAHPERVLLEVSANTAVSGTWLSWRTPAFFAPGDAALDLAASILTSERLLTELVDAQLASGVVAHDRSFLEGSVFRIAATGAVGIAPLHVARAVEAAVGRLSKHVTHDELLHAKRQLRGMHLDALSSTEGRAGLLASLGQVGPVNGPLLDQSMARYEAVTEEDVAHAVSTWLSPRTQVTILVVPSRGAPVAGHLEARARGLP